MQNVPIALIVRLWYYNSGIVLAPWSFVAYFILTPFGKGPAPFSCGSWAFAVIGY